MKRFPITQKGLEKLEQELKQLKHIERPKVIEAIATARELGDLSENAEYHAAREKQGYMESRISDLESKYSRVEVIDIGQVANKDRIQFGATVELLNEVTDEVFSYYILGEYEADTKRRFISIKSPMPKASIGKSVGDVVEVNTPKGIITYEIIKIE